MTNPTRQPAVLLAKRERELDTTLRTDLCAFNDNRLAVPDRRPTFGPRPDPDTSGFPLR